MSQVVNQPTAVDNVYSTALKSTLSVQIADIQIEYYGPNIISG